MATSRSHESSTGVTSDREWAARSDRSRGDRRAGSGGPGGPVGAGGPVDREDPVGLGLSLGERAAGPVRGPVGPLSGQQKGGDDDGNGEGGEKVEHDGGQIRATALTNRGCWGSRSGVASKSNRCPSPTVKDPRTLVQPRHGREGAGERVPEGCAEQASGERSLWGNTEERKPCVVRWFCLSGTAHDPDRRHQGHEGRHRGRPAQSESAEHSALGAQRTEPRLHLARRGLRRRGPVRSVAVRWGDTSERPGWDFVPLLTESWKERLPS